MNENPEKSGIIRDEEGKFVKGVSGNPEGRPAGTLSLIGMLKAKLQEIEPNSKKQYAELLINRITKDAIADGNDKQIRNILQYVEGMPKQSIDMTTGGKPFTTAAVEFVGDDDADKQSQS